MFILYQKLPKNFDENDLLIHTNFLAMISKHLFCYYKAVFFLVNNGWKKFNERSIPAKSQHRRYYSCGSHTQKRGFVKILKQKI